MVEFVRLTGPTLLRLPCARPSLVARPCCVVAPRRHRSQQSIRCSISSNNHRAKRYAVLGAGFSGLSVAWHLLEIASKASPLCVDIYDEVGIGGGASGSAGGLVHPYSPKAKALWRGQECWEECLKLLKVAERAMDSRCLNGMLGDLHFFPDGPIICRRFSTFLDPSTPMQVTLITCVHRVSSAYLNQTVLILWIAPHALIEFLFLSEFKAKWKFSFMSNAKSSVAQN